ncbi:MAG TPA: response regulator [Ktedonobacteraceae bacterium]|nr:response regulator [Ktedonobacteraceae bacterium]
MQTKATLKPDKILVVDDDPIIRDMMVDILDLEGYPVQVARNGLQALEVLQGKENFLVFLDLLMPVMSGGEVCLALAAEPELRRRHIIVLISALDRLDEAASLNVNTVMPKPFSTDDVMRIVESYMK